MSHSIADDTGEHRVEREKINDSITPVLISWLKHASTRQTEDMVKLDNIILDKFKICGRVVSYNSKTTKTYVKIEDSTEIIECSCNKKFDEEVPKVLKDINIEK